MATQRIRLKPISPVSIEQKVAFGLLMFLGLGGVVFGFQSFGANMQRPIQKQMKDLYTGEQYLSQDQIDEQEREASKTKDTDADGLVDYDELYVYKTSPYIVDSDSDGYDDKTEIFSGNNPNCPVDKTCGFVVTSDEEATASNTIADAFVQSLGAGALIEAGSVKFNSAADVEAFFKQATMDQIRADLIESGMSQEELDAIDDDTLRAFFNGALDEASFSGSLDQYVDPTQ